MDGLNEMSVALERLITPQTGTPQREAETEPGLEVAVVFTSVKATLAALKAAGNITRRLHAHITLLVPQIVPHPLPLSSPPVLIEFSERRLRVLAEGSPVPTTVRIFLCRERSQTLLQVLKPHSLVVLGGHKRWWPTAEMQLAKQLRRGGHEVIETETE
jgi:hypothetical protein